MVQKRIAPIRVNEEIKKQLEKLNKYRSLNKTIQALLDDRKKLNAYKKQLDGFHKEKELQIQKLLLRVKAIKLKSNGLIYGDDMKAYVLGIFPGGRE